MVRPDPGHDGGRKGCSQPAHFCIWRSSSVLDVGPLASICGEERCPGLRLRSPLLPGWCSPQMRDGFQLALLQPRLSVTTLP